MIGSLGITVQAAQRLVAHLDVTSQGCTLPLPLRAHKLLRNLRLRLVYPLDHVNTVEILEVYTKYRLLMGQMIAVAIQIQVLITVTRTADQPQVPPHAVSACVIEIRTHLQLN